jgi:hypothetical protein
MYIQRVIVVEPNKDPYIKEIENNFSEMQKLVRGPLNFKYLEDGFFIINHTACNEKNCQSNYDLHGTFLITKGLENVDTEGITGLSIEEAQSVMDLLFDLKNTTSSILQFPKAIGKRQEYKIS